MVSPFTLDRHNLFQNRGLVFRLLSEMFRLRHFFSPISTHLILFAGIFIFLAGWMMRTRMMRGVAYLFVFPQLPKVAWVILPAWACEKSVLFDTALSSAKAAAGMRGCVKGALIRL